MTSTSFEINTTIKDDEHTKRFIEEFTKKLDLKQKYSLEKMKKIVGDIFKDTKKNRRVRTNQDGEIIKKKPSEYNIFIKENMENIKKNNLDIKDNKILLKKAAELWKIEKEKRAENNL